MSHSFTTEQLLELLKLNTSNHNPERRKAESDLEALNGLPGYCINLILIAETEGVMLDLRRLALIVLRGTLKNHWHKIRNDEKSPMFETLFGLCRDPSVRVLACAALAMGIAQDPENSWSLFLGALESLAQQSAEASIELIFACTESCRSSELITLLPIMKGLLGTCMANPSQYPAQLAASFKSLNAMLALENRSEDMQQCSKELFPHLTGLLTCEVTVDNFVYVQEAAPLARNMLLFDSRNQLIGNINDDFISNLIGSLEHDLPKMENAMNTLNALDESEEMAALVRCLANKLDLFRLLIGDTHFKSQVISALSQAFVPLITVLLKYAILSADQVVTFEEDYSKFLEAEENRLDGDSGEVRDTAMLCIRAAIVRFKQGFIAIYDQALGECFGLEINEGNWRAREAALCSLEFCLAHKTSRALLEQHGVARDSLCADLLDKDLTGNVPTLLTSRALMLFKMFTKYPVGLSGAAQQHILTNLPGPCISTMSSPNRILASCSCKLLINLVRELANKDCNAVIGEHANSCIQATNNLFVDQSLMDKPLYGVIELAIIWLNKCPAQLEAAVHVPEAFTQCWRRNQSDPEVGSLALPLMKAVIKRPECEGGISGWVKWMMPILQGQGDMAATCCTPAILDLISVTLNRGNDNLCQLTCQHMIAPMCQLLLTCDDDSTAVVTTGSKCLVAMMKRFGDALGDASIMLMPSVLQVPPGLPSGEERPISVDLPRAIIAVVANFLSEHRPESSLLSDVEEFLLAVIHRMGKHLRQNETKQFVNCLVNRMNTTSKEIVLERLTTPLATIMCQATRWTLDTLVDSNELEYLFTQWLNAQSEFTRVKTILVTSQALLMVLQEGGDQLRNYNVFMKVVGSRRAKKNKVLLPVAIFIALGKTICAVEENRELYEDDEFDDEDADETGTYTDGGAAEDDFDEDDEDEEVDNKDGLQDDDDDGGSSAPSGSAFHTPQTGGSSSTAFGAALGGGGGEDEDGDWVDETPYQKIKQVLLELGQYVAAFSDAAAPFFTPAEQRVIRQYLNDGKQ